MGGKVNAGESGFYSGSNFRYYGIGWWEQICGGGGEELGVNGVRLQIGVWW